MRLLGRCLCVFLLASSGAAMAVPVAPTRDGGDIIQTFQKGLAAPGCTDASLRWRVHYARAAARLARQDEAALALFGYVLDEVRNAGLPSELALIPFIESRYHADVRSIGGPAGLWQFTRATARRHGLLVTPGADQRMSAASSTRAAVVYLKRLHRMFGRQWRQTAMAYNAGDAALKASRRKGGRPLSAITRSYPLKLHAIACLFDEHDKRVRWRNTVDRQVPRLAPRTLPAGTRNLRGWARAHGLDPTLVADLNPGWHSGLREVLAPVMAHATAGPDSNGKAN